MSKTVTVPLSQPIQGHKGQITSVAVREPSYMEFAEIGEPRVLARTADGSVYSVENDAAIAAYLAKCVDVDSLLLASQASLRDAIAIKQALLDFFQSAREALQKATPSAQTSSSSI